MFLKDQSFIYYTDKIVILTSSYLAEFYCNWILFCFSIKWFALWISLDASGFKKGVREKFDYKWLKIIYRTYAVYIIHKET